MPVTFAIAPTCTTEIHFIYNVVVTSLVRESGSPVPSGRGGCHQAGTTSSLDAWQYYNPIAWWLDTMDELHEAARQRQRVVWFAPQKVRVMAPVPPFRRYQKIFQKHLFPLGRKK